MAEQSSIWKVASETLPLVSLGGVALALSYTVGFFMPFGMQWLSFLTVADMLGRVWFLIPTSMVGLLGGFLFFATGKPRQIQNAGEGRATKAVTVIKNIIVGSLAVLGFSAIMIARAIFPEDIKLLSALTMMHGIGVFFLPELYFGHVRIRAILTLCFAYSAITFVLGFGMLSGEAIKREAPNSYVALTNGRSFCTILVGQFGGDLLTYDPKTDSTTLIKRERIAAVAKLKKCAKS